MGCGVEVSGLVGPEKELCGVAGCAVEDVSGVTGLGAVEGKGDGLGVSGFAAPGTVEVGVLVVGVGAVSGLAGFGLKGGGVGFDITDGGVVGFD